MEKRSVRTSLSIEGMHCHNCENRMEHALSAIPGVLKARADYVGSRADITYDPDKLDLDQITEAIERLDYRVKAPGDRQDGRPSFRYLIGLGIIILAGYLILNNTSGFGFVPAISRNMGYGLLFVVGLMTSLHCVAMCGGINISQCAGYQPEAGAGGRIRQLMPSLRYNLGRVISYTVIGGLAGALGGLAGFSGAARGIVPIIAGGFMVIMGLNMINIFPGLRRLTPRLPGRLRQLTGPMDTRKGPFYAGLLNGFMPCGPLQAMQLYALGTGSAVAGALSMMVFSLGTVPLMFGLGAVSSFLTGRFKQRMIRAGGVLVVVLGMIMLSRGLNLSGINLASASTSYNGSAGTARIEGQAQVVETTLESGRYTPIVVQKGIPVKWTINAAESDLNGCNRAIAIPEYNIQAELVPGKNVIEEFTPREEGKITYTCWMGMIKSTITVVSDLSQVSARDLQGTASSAGSAPCACCR